MSKNYSEYAAKDITPTMAAFAEWLTKETGYAVDPRTVALAGSLRSDFQASESWKGDARNPRNGAEARREAKAQAAIEAAKEAARKANERIAKLEQAVKDAKAAQAAQTKAASKAA